MEERKNVQKIRHLELQNVTQHPKLGAQIYVTDSGRAFVYQTVKVNKHEQARYVKSGKFEVINALTPQLLWEAVMECLKCGKDWQAIQDVNSHAD